MSETNPSPDNGGIRPFQQRSRRPMIGEPLSPAQVEMVRGLVREEIAALYQRVTKGEDLSLVPESPPEAPDPSPDESQPPAVKELPSVIETTETIPGATPAMLALINEVGPDGNAELKKIAGSDLPPSVRLAQMRKTFNTRTA